MNQLKELNLKSSFGMYDIPMEVHHAQQDKKDTCIILCHGLGSNKKGFLEFYKNISIQLALKGISSIRFDFVAHGDSEVSGDFFTVRSQINDLFDVYNWAKNEFKNDQIKLFGTSFGAFPCIYLGKLFSDVKHINLLAPVLDYERTFVNPITPWGIDVFTDFLQRTLINGERIEITDSIYFDNKIAFELSSINIENILASIDADIKIMHGDNDGMVSYDISKKIASKYDNIRFFSFENMEHGFTNKDDETGEHPRTKENFNRIIELLIE